MSSAQRQILVIARVFDIIQFDNMLQKCFNCSYRGSTSLPSRIIEPSTHWTFTCSKSVVWNLWKIFVKEFIFNKVLELLPVALLKQLLDRYFSRSLIIDFRIPIFTERLSVAAQNSQISHFFCETGTCMLKSIFAFLIECIFYRHKSKNRVHV